MVTVPMNPELELEPTRINNEEEPREQLEKL
jgi:hypothetical protein